MKALQYNSFGGIENLKLTDIPEPTVSENKVRIKVTAVGLNPMDWAIMGNEALAQNFGVQLPMTFGYDFAGIIDQISEDVTDFAVGDRVYGSTLTGAAAEKIIMPASGQQLFHTPDNISDEIASTLTVAVSTAAVAIRKAKISVNDTLLVGGAAGGVGTFVVQIAKNLGAKVIGTASESTASYLAKLGADQVKYGAGLIDRLTEKHITAAIELHNQEVVDTALALGIPANRITTIIMFPQPPEGVTTSTGSEVEYEEFQAVIDQVSAGTIKVPIATIYSIEDYAKAISAQAARHVHGKIVMIF